MTGTSLSGADYEELLRKEWLLSNKLGGYACSTVAGVNTRKYHGLLVAAMSPPVRRMVLLSKVEEMVVAEKGGEGHPLSSNEYPGVVHPQGYRLLVDFEHDPIPRWTYRGKNWTLVKELRLLEGENAVCLRYSLLHADNEIELSVRPLFALRSIHELSYQWNGKLGAEPWESRSAGQSRRPNNAEARDWRIPPTGRTPEVFFAHDGAFVAQGLWYLNTIYRCEEQRGYSGLEDLWNPGVATFALAPGRSASFVCSSEPIQLDKALAKAGTQYGRKVMVGAPDPLGSDTLEQLKRSADQFILELPQEGAERNIAVASQYPWSAPASRASLIGFGGLFLVTGKLVEGRLLLQRLIGKMRNGLLPSESPENGGQSLYHAADVSLWWIHATNEYLRYSGDEQSARLWLDKVLEIIDRYRHGTELGIGCDQDGLIVSHAAGIGTSWMDAKVGDWVITPRQGRPVELNALWYNALRIAANWCARFGHDLKAEELETCAASMKQAFNRRFWHDEAQCCYDVVEEHGVDPTIRPNQLLAISLPHAVLELSRHTKVLEKVITELLTPVGVRTLSPKDPGYQGHYRGNVIERDRAYHQGTAFPWLLGPLVSAYVKVHGRGTGAQGKAKELLGGCIEYVRRHGMLCELFDGDAPHGCGGAIASAMATGELLRAYVEDVLDVIPASERARLPGAEAQPIRRPPVPS